MPLFYSVQMRKNPQDLEKDPLYYLVAKSWGHADREMLIKNMVKHTSLNPYEAASAIDYLFNTIPEYLEAGQTVKLGKIGYMKCSIKSRAVENEEDATPETIKRISLHFIPGKYVREMIESIPVEKFPEM